MSVVPDSRIAAERDCAMDLTKGALVLLMVFYHWLNYFVAKEGFFYRYIRFITPSFIFIAGFVVVYVYGNRFQNGGKISGRLVWRGCKLILIFTMANVLISLLRGPLDPKGEADRLLLSCITGSSTGVAFQVLAPIGYLLIACGILFRIEELCRVGICAISGFLFVMVLAMESLGVVNGNLELVGIGFLGAFLGRWSPEVVGKSEKAGLILGMGYLCHCVLLTYYEAIYPLQVTGVCLCVLGLYFIFSNSKVCTPVMERVSLLGRYSLFGYLAQIAILQVLGKLLRPGIPERLRQGSALLIAVIATIFVVEMVQAGRRCSITCDRIYRAIFM